MVNIQNNFIGITSHHISLRNLDYNRGHFNFLTPRFTNRESMKYQGKNELLKHMESS
jgi:hypothetical protein